MSTLFVGITVYIPFRIKIRPQLGSFSLNDVSRNFRNKFIIVHYYLGFEGKFKSNNVGMPEKIKYVGAMLINLRQLL